MVPHTLDHLRKMVKITSGLILLATDGKIWNMMVKKLQVQYQGKFLLLKLTVE